MAQLSLRVFVAVYVAFVIAVEMPSASFAASNNSSLATTKSGTSRSATSRSAANGGIEEVDAIKLLMTSDFYGNVTAFISPFGVRFTSSRTGMQLVALPPDGRMFAFNDEAKKIYKVDMKRFKMFSTFRRHYEESKLDARFFPTGKRGKVGGVNAVEFANYRKKDLPLFKEMRIKAIRNGYPDLIVFPSEIWASTELMIPEAFISIVAKISQTSERELFQLCGPKKRKLKQAPLPLRISRVADDGRKMLTIDTQSVMKTKATAKDFVVPSGYKPVANEIQLFMGDDSLDLEELDKDINSPSKNIDTGSKHTDSRSTKNSELQQKAPWGFGFPQ